MAERTSDPMELPVFPLPGMVLLPGEVVPLHIFEPRYREMIAHCTEGDGRFAMGTPAGGDPDHPALHPELGVGRIVRLQPLPDGRSNLLLAYETAARIDTELEVDTPFRQVRVTPLPEVTPASYGDVTLLRVLATQVLAAIGPVGGREQVLELDGHHLVDGLAVLLLREPAPRLAYLRATTGAQRAALVQAAMFDVLAQAQAQADDAVH